MSYRITEAERKHVFTIEDLDIFVRKVENPSDPQYEFVFSDNDVLDYSVPMPYHKLEYIPEVNTLSLSTYINGARFGIGESVHIGWEDQIRAQKYSYIQEVESIGSNGIPIITKTPIVTDYISGFEIWRTNDYTYDAANKTYLPKETFKGSIQLNNLTSLNVSGMLTAESELKVKSNLDVAGNIIQSGQGSTITLGDATANTMHINGASTLNGKVTVDNDIIINDTTETIDAPTPEDPEHKETITIPHKITATNAEFTNIKSTNFELGDNVVYNSLEDKLSINAKIIATSDDTAYIKNLVVQDLKVGKIDIAALEETGDAPLIGGNTDEIIVANGYISGLEITKSLNISGVWEEQQKLDEENNPMFDEENNPIMENIFKDASLTIKGNNSLFGTNIISGINTISGNNNIIEGTTFINGLTTFDSKSIFELGLNIAEGGLEVSGNLTLGNNSQLELGTTGSITIDETNAIESSFNVMSIEDVTITKTEITDAFIDNAVISGLRISGILPFLTSSSTGLDIENDLNINVKSNFSSGIVTNTIYTSSLTINNGITSGSLNVGDLNAKDISGISASFTGALDVNNTANIDGAITTGSSITATGDISGANFFTLGNISGGSLDIVENANINGNTTINNELTINGIKFTNFDRTLKDGTYQLSITKSTTPADTSANPPTQEQVIYSDYKWIKDSEYKIPNQVLFETYFKDNQIVPTNENIYKIPVSEILSFGTESPEDITYEVSASSFTGNQEIINSGIINNNTVYCNKPCILKLTVKTSYWNKTYYLNVWRNYVTDVEFKNGSVIFYDYIKLLETGLTSFSFRDDIIITYADDTKAPILNDNNYSWKLLNRGGAAIMPQNNFTYELSTTHIDEDNLDFVVVIKGYKDKYGLKDFTKKFKFTIYTEETFNSKFVQ